MSTTVGLVFDEQPIFTCPVCGKEFTRESYLQKHIEKNHQSGDEAPQGTQAPE